MRVSHSIVRRLCTCPFGPPSAYHRARPPFPAGVLDRILERAARRKQTSGVLQVIDVGCGTGRPALELARRGASVTAVDPSLAMLQVLSREAIAAGFPVKTVLGCAERLGGDDGSADLVTCFDAFHWFEARPALCEFARVLRPSGLHVVAWNDLTELDTLEALGFCVPRPNDKWAGVFTSSGLFKPLPEGSASSRGSCAPSAGLERDSHEFWCNAASLARLCRTYRFGRMLPREVRMGKEPSAAHCAADTLAKQLWRLSRASTRAASAKEPAVGQGDGNSPWDDGYFDDGTESIRLEYVAKTYTMQRRL